MSRRKSAPVVYVSLADIARSVNIDPKRARATFRRMPADELATFDRHPDVRHSFAEMSRDAVIARLTRNA